MAVISLLILYLNLVTGCAAPHAVWTTTQTSANQHQDEPSTVGFTTLGLGEMQDVDEGISLGFTTYAASDGTSVIAMDYEFHSVEKAKIYFEKKLSKAVNVVDREDNVNRDGKVVGERAQIFMPLENGKNEPAVLWTNGRMFREIFSSSLTNILELEKVYRR